MPRKGMMQMMKTQFNVQTVGFFFFSFIGDRICLDVS
jgi:hypothetical protein